MNSENNNSSAIDMRQPRGMYTLFFTELWERFSYYGMRALFILYMTNALLFSDEKSYATYGIYGTLIYITPILGGMIADRFFGYKACVIFGGVLMALGNFSLTIQALPSFYLGLALLVVGNGLLKPNVASILGQLYTKDDPRRNPGFTLYYVGVNIGGFLAPLLCGYIGQEYGWHYGFGLAGIGMLLGLVVFIKGMASDALKSHGLPPKPALLKQRLCSYLPVSIRFSIILVILIAIPITISFFLINITGWLLLITGIGVFGYLLIVAFTSEPEERNKLLTLIVFMIFAMLFWSFSEQAGSSLNLFTERDINRHLFSLIIPTSMFQAVNPIFIFIVGPVFAALWVRLGKRNLEPSTGVKFGLGLLQLAAGFLVFAVGAQFALLYGSASMTWLILGYLLMTTGELCIEPIGISMVSRLAPVKLLGLLMGCWYLADGAFSNYVAAKIASYTSVPTGETDVVAIGAHLYNKVFMDIAIVAAIIGVFILIVSPWLKRLANERG